MTMQPAQPHLSIASSVCIAAQVLAVAVHNHYKRLQNKRMSRSAYPYEGSLANVPSSQLVRCSSCSSQLGC
jgi:hypothetical protein